MNGLGLCINLNTFVSHILYAWSLCHNSSVKVDIKYNTYLISLNRYTTVFAWRADNYN